MYHNLDHIYPPMTSSLNVAVIGAGVAGLVAARELLRENHQVVVFEKSEQVGGTWVYDPQVEDDGQLFSRHEQKRAATVHSSLYSSLRTNLPRHLMGFSDYSFEDKVYDDPRMFPGHQEVLKFLQDFAEKFGLIDLIRFDSEVVRVERVDSENTEFLVQWRKTSAASSESEEELFDAVVVCNGHLTEPRIAIDIPGIEKWSRKQVHSHNYRVPEPFRDQVVVMIGNGPSALDISREIATVAKEVHLSSRSPNVKASKLHGHGHGHDNIWQHSKIDRVCEDGKVVFEDGFYIEADIIFHCTGYKFHFPFLHSYDIVSVEDNRVGPLYRHVFPPRLAPRLSFVGIPYSQGVLFRMFELQSKWTAQALSGKISLPSENKMLADIDEHYRKMEQTGIPKRHTHSLKFQFEYVDWLAAQVGSRVEDRLKNICRNRINHLISHPDGIRDSFVIENELLSPQNCT